MDLIAQYLEIIVGIVWGTPTIFLLLGSGLLFSIVLGGIQFKGFYHAFKVLRGHYDNPDDPGEITHFQSLTTALSATVGLGNIGGVAIAIHVGGPGAVFWMIVTGLLGMSTKFVECTHAVKYRRIGKDGRIQGGPMYYIVDGLGPAWKPMAVFFAVAAVCSSIGAANMYQTNQVASILHANFSIPHLATGLTMALLTAMVIFGGIQSIGKVTSRLVPYMGGLYFIGATVIILLNITSVPALFAQIFTDAFTGTAAVGGFSGAALRQVFMQGVKRACFSNEAGLGSAPFAHAAAKTKEPVREGVVALLEPFIDTVVICTMTALVILLSGQWQVDGLKDVQMTANAFNSGIPGFGTYFVPVAVFLFAYSTLLSWSYYGSQAIQFIFKGRGESLYKTIFCLSAILGATWKLDPVLNFSDIMFGLMIFPNLLANIILLPNLRRETQDYFKRMKAL